MSAPIVSLVLSVTVLTVLVGMMENTTVGPPDVEVAVHEAQPRDCRGIGGVMECAWGAVAGFLATVWAFVALVGRTVVFDVPGAPMPVRAVIVSYFAANGVWIAAAYMRGVKSE